MAFGQGRLTEARTVLGMLLRIGPLDDEVLTAYFSGIQYKTPADLEAAKGILQENILTLTLTLTLTLILTLQENISALQSRIPGIFLSLLRGKRTKDAAVKWIALALQMNQGRTKDMYISYGAAEVLEQPMPNANPNANLTLFGRSWSSRWFKASSRSPRTPSW